MLSPGCRSAANRWRSRGAMSILVLAIALVGAVAPVVPGCGPQHPRVLLSTDLGEIVVEVYPDRAPLTAANFLRYVRESRFRGACFYRTVTPDNQPDKAVKIEVIQGGLKDDPDSLALPPIPHETTAQTGLRHQDGTISMARNEPGTASSEIFICIGNQPELDFGGKRNPDGQGFAAFGRVVVGMDVVRAIQARPADGQSLTPEIKITGVSLVTCGD
jgi:peptidyl-prolyl cis-trans isomerase A (cyclophilin A)